MLEPFKLTRDELQMRTITALEAGGIPEGEEPRVLADARLLATCAPSAPVSGRRVSDAWTPAAQLHVRRV